VIVVTLIYANGSQWIAGGFDTLDAANAWIANEQAQPYWDPATEAQITDNAPPAEAP
jgi:hypothetical protein